MGYGIWYLLPPLRYTHSLCEKAGRVTIGSDQYFLLYHHCSLPKFPSSQGSAGNRSAASVLSTCVIDTAGPELVEEQPQSVFLISLSLTELCKLLPSASEQWPQLYKVTKYRFFSLPFTTYVPSRHLVSLSGLVHIIGPVALLEWSSTKEIMPGPVHQAFLLHSTHHMPDTICT